MDTIYIQYLAAIILVTVHHLIDKNNELYAIEYKDDCRIEVMDDDIQKSVSREYLRADFKC